MNRMESKWVVCHSARTSSAEYMYRCKIINIHIVWNNLMPPGVVVVRLTPVKSWLNDHSIAIKLIYNIVITFDKTKGCFRLPYPFRTKSIIFLQKCHEIPEMAIPREVQVNIGYFVTFETKETFKREYHDHLLPTYVRIFLDIFIRHIIT